MKNKNDGASVAGSSYVLESNTPSYGVVQQLFCFDRKKEVIIASCRRVSELGRRGGSCAVAGAVLYVVCGFHVHVLRVLHVVAG